MTGLHFIAVTTLLSVLFAWYVARNNNRFNQPQSENIGKFDLFTHVPLWVSIFLMQVSFGAFYSFFTIYESEHGLSLEMISYLWTFGVLCEIVLFYFQGHLLHYPLMRVIRFSIFMTSIRWLLLYLFPDTLTVVFLAQSLHALSFALYHSATLTYLNHIYEDKKLAAQFYYGIGFGLGGFTGSLIAGYVYGSYLFLVSAVIAFGAFAVLFAGKKEPLRAS
jgi:PPP family 3-phenylpropionic acid transporter